jgi:hypothetical protein
LFDGNRKAQLLQPGDSYKVGVSILRCDPPPKHHPARARDSEHVAIPRWRGGVGGQGPVGVVGVNELCEIREKGHA